MSRKTSFDDDWKSKLVQVLTNDQSSNDDIYQVLSQSNHIKDICFEEIIQEALVYGMRRTVLKDLPPVIRNSICLSLIEEAKDFAPDVLKLVIKFCTKPNEPITEKQGRKIVHLISLLLSCLNQKDSALQKLKLVSVTNSGLDFLNDQAYNCLILFYKRGP